MTHVRKITQGDCFILNGKPVEAQGTPVEGGEAHGAKLIITVAPLDGGEAYKTLIPMFTTINTWRKPEVGMGATLMYPQDMYPYVVTRVSDTGKTVWVKPLDQVSLETGHQPARYSGPFPVWSHQYTDEERERMVLDAPEVAVRLTKNGWQRNSTPVSLGAAHYHRDFSW